MNALRTLPILNRPSRPASPAPPSVQSTTVNGTATPYPTHPAAPNGHGHPAQQGDKPRSRSLSRQVADKVSSLQNGGNSAAPAATAAAGAGGQGGQGAMHPPATIVSSQPLGGKKPSPPGSRAGTPRVPASPLPGAVGPGAGGAGVAGAGANGVGAGGEGPQGGYMDVIGLRLNEMVNKAIAGVDIKAKKGLKKGNGWAVGESVVKELPYPPSDAYLIRAVLRTSVRALSIYTTRLESLLLPALTDPTFPSPLNITNSTPSSHALNPAQHFAVTIAHAAWETCEVLEQALETGKWPRFVAETLRPVMDKLDLVVSKVVQPLLGGLKRDLVASLARTEGTSPSGGKPVGLASIPAPAATAPGTTPLARESSHPAVNRLTKEISQSGTSRQATIPIPVCLQHFASRVDGARKVFELVAKPCQDDGEGWVTGVMVAVIWKGMCVVADKDVGAGAAARPPSPGSVARALAGLGAGKEKDSSAPPAAGITPSPSLGGVTAKLASSLSIVPSRSQSRAPSPPRGAAAAASRLDPTTHALLSLEGLAKRLVAGLVQPPAPEGTLTDENATEHLAREALHEALEALASFRIISSAMHRGVSPGGRVLASARRLRDDGEEPEEDELDDAMEDLPAVSLFTIILRQANLALSRLPAASGDEKTPAPVKLRLPHEVWGWTPAEYERQVLSGFSAAEEWGRRVALGIKPDVERALGLLAGMAARAHPSSTPTVSATPANGRVNGVVAGGEKGVSQQERALGEAVEWVKALGVACEARCGVKIAGAV
ncbi:hypothetical protein IAT38_008398 [Cryptococcus sp. DSM 104549]